MTHPTPDFVDHLAERLGVAREAAFERLGDWIYDYKPIRRREIRVLTGAPSAAMPSGEPQRAESRTRLSIVVAQAQTPAEPLAEPAVIERRRAYR